MNSLYPLKKKPIMSISVATSANQNWVRNPEANNFYLSTVGTSEVHTCNMQLNLLMKISFRQTNIHSLYYSLISIQIKLMSMFILQNKRSNLKMNASFTII